MEALITLLPGDGIGPEVATAGRAALEAVASKYSHKFRFSEQLIGGASIDACGDPLPSDTIAACKDSNAVLLGAVGGPKWSDPNATVRPEQGLLKLRSTLGVYANLRPVNVYPELAGASPLKNERLEGVDLMVVRELTGGIYFGEKSRSDTSASDLCAYHRHEVERIIRTAAELARKRQVVFRRQGQCPGNVATLEGHYRPIDGQRLSRHRTGNAARRRRCNAPAQPAGRFRRHRHGEYVRRHSNGRGFHALGLARHAAVGVTRRFGARPV